MNKIEKCARLMGYTIAECKPDFNYYHLDADTVGTFNPLTNKSDLMGLECELGIDICWREHSLIALTSSSIFAFGVYADHPTKFAARAEAVIAVAVQIYDAKYGKDGE